MEDISKMLGHTDARTTMLHLDINVERLRKMTERRDDYLSMVRERMKMEPSVKEEILLFAQYRHRQRLLSTKA